MAATSMLTDAQLAELCELPPDSTPDVFEMLRTTARLLIHHQWRNDSSAAVTLAVAMGRSSVWAVKLGNPGQSVEQEGWIDWKSLALKLTQLGGLILGKKFDANSADLAIHVAVKEYWLREETYDAWHPGMRSGSGRTSAVQAQPVGIARALEQADAISTASQPEMSLEKSEPTATDQTAVDREIEADAPTKTPPNNEAADEPMPVDGVEANQQPLDRTWLAKMVMCSYSLRDLRMANTLYPGAITKKEFDSLEKELSSWIEMGLAQPGFEKFRELVNLSDDPRSVTLVAALLLNHPDVTVCDESHFDQAMRECETKDIGDANKPIQRVIDIRIWNCFVPKPVDGEEYCDPRRHLRLIELYWQALKPVIFCEMGAYIHRSPHPLIKWIINLRRRVQICFGEIKEVENAAESQEDFECLVEALLGDPDDLQAGEERAQRLVRNIDRFLAEATVTLSLGGLELTREESDFLKVFNKLASDHVEDVKQGKARANKYLKKVGEERRATQAPLATKDGAANAEPSKEDGVTGTGAPQPPKDSSDFAKPASVRARVSQAKVEKALEFIRKKPGSKGVTIAGHIEVEEPTFRSNYGPILKDRGVRNDGDGYYLPK